MQEVRFSIVHLTSSFSDGFKKCITSRKILWLKEKVLKKKMRLVPLINKVQKPTKS